MLPPIVSDGFNLSKPVMQLLVLAQTPPPLHGQSLMVQTLVAGLPSYGVALHHVPLNLSRDQTDIGRWRPGKVFAVFAAALRAVAARFTRHCDTLYYVPAPGKRSALYRDWAVLLLVRPFFRRLVLHFHNGGLGEWLATQATAPERWVTRVLLGRADLALVLAPALQVDAIALDARRIAIVPNGIVDPCPAWTLRSGGDKEVTQVLFLGLCTEAKGLFDAVAAVLAVNCQLGVPAFSLVAAGNFPDEAEAARFRELAAAHPSVLRYAGFVCGEAKLNLLRGCDVLCFPTRYAHEAQPLVVIEALAHDLSVIATDWRGLASMLPPDTALVPPGDTSALAGALIAWRNGRGSLPTGVARQHFLAHFTVERHLTRLAAELLTLRTS